MPARIGCTCTRPVPLRTGGSLLLATRVAHHVDALRALVREHGGEARERIPGVLEIRTDDVAGLIVAAQRQLTSVEAAEVRAVQLDGRSDDDLLALAMVAPTLAQLGACAQHADPTPRGLPDAVSAAVVPAVAVDAPTAASPAAVAGVPADLDALLARAVGVTSSGVTIADATRAEMPLVYVNEAFTSVTGYAADEVLGRNCRLLQGPETDPDVVARLREAVREGRDHVALVLNYRKDGSSWWNELRLSPVRDPAGVVTHYFGFQLDVTARIEAQQAATHLADHDPLTGLANRSCLLRVLEERTAAGQRSGTAWALLFIDLDGFKDVNDSYGHEAGDRVLAEAARRLRAAIGPEHLVARYGGDEFIVVMAVAAEDEVERLAERAVQTITDALGCSAHDAAPGAVVGASTGIAVFPLDGATGHQLLRSADHAMFAAKTARSAHRPASVRGEPALPRTPS